MKKISLTLAVASALGASAANAAIMAEYANGIVVPRVFYDSAENQDTAIGLTACHEGTVYWAFYNAGSQKLLDGQFPMTTNDQASFVWSEFRGAGGLARTNGYMTFLLDTDGDGRLGPNDSTCLAGNAFFVDTSSRDDVAFVPVFPLNWAWNDFRLGPDGRTAFSLASPNGVTDIIGMWAGARAGDTIHMRYFQDGAFESGDSTQIYIWGANPFSYNGTIDQYDNVQTRSSLNMRVSGELAIIDIEDPAQTTFSTVVGYPDGFFEWRIPSAVVNVEDPDFIGDCDNNAATPDEFCVNDYIAAREAAVNANRQFSGIVSWSIVSSDNFQATQTLLNPVLKPHIADGDDVWEEGERFNVFERYNPAGVTLFPALRDNDGNPILFFGDELGVGDDPDDGTAPRPGRPAPKPQCENFPETRQTTAEDVYCLDILPTID